MDSHIADLTSVILSVKSSSFRFMSCDRYEYFVDHLIDTSGKATKLGVLGSSLSDGKYFSGFCFQKYFAISW